MTRAYFTKKTREGAADACMLIASSEHPGTLNYEDVGVEKDSREAALARAAFWAIPDDILAGDSLDDKARTWWGEAELLLRSGWRPGDPVEVFPLDATTESVTAILKGIYSTAAMQEMADRDIGPDYFKNSRLDSGVGYSEETSTVSPELVDDILKTNGFQHEAPEETFQEFDAERPSEDALDQEDNVSIDHLVAAELADGS